GYDTGFVYERFDELRVDSGDATRTKIKQAIAGTLTRADGSPLDPTGTPIFFNPFIGQNAPVIGFAPTYVNGVPTGLTAPYNNLLTSQVAAYLQLGVPIVTSTMNVPFVRSLDIDLAWRYEKYDDFNQGNPGDPFSRKQSASFDNPNPDENFGGSPRVSLRYQPTPDITLRA